MHAAIAAATALPLAPAGHIYQLWAQPSQDTEMRSAGLLSAIF